MQRSTGHSKLGVSCSTLIEESVTICPNLIRIDAAAKGTIVYQRISLPSVVLYIRIQFGNKFDITGEVQRGHRQLQGHQILTVQAYQLAGAETDLLATIALPFHFPGYNTLVHMQGTSIGQDPSPAEIKPFTIHIDFYPLAVGQIQQTLAHGGETIVPFTVANMLRLVETIDKVAFQTSIDIKIIAFHKGATGSQITVGQGKSCFIAVVQLFREFCFCNAPAFDRIDRCLKLHPITP